MSKSAFRDDLEHLINRHSIENGSDTPDFMLADYLVNCLAAFETAIERREKWYSRPGPIGYGSPATSPATLPILKAALADKE